MFAFKMAFAYTFFAQCLSLEADARLRCWKKNSKFRENSAVSMLTMGGSCKVSFHPISRISEFIGQEKIQKKQQTNILLVKLS